MKIGFDVSQTGKSKAGCGFFAKNLIHHLSTIDIENQYILYPTFGDYFFDEEYAKNYFVNQSNFHIGITHKHIEEAKQFWHLTTDQIERDLGNLDILHANNFFCPPGFSNSRIVYTLYDLSFLEYPDCTTEVNRIACFDGVFKASLNADLIISISNYSREHFLEVFPYYPKERIVVIHPASRFSENLTNSSIPKRFKDIQPQKFWLNVGTIEPRKNIKHLLQTYARLKSCCPQTPTLILAGQKGWLMDDINCIIESLNLSHSVQILGYVSEQELEWLYKNCFCLVYPSLFEGFGLPVLEAMSFGAPVISSNVSSIPEVAGKAALLINPTDENELFQAMLEITNNLDLVEKLKQLSIQQANCFSWNNAAKTTLHYYREVMSMPKRIAKVELPV